ncbi:hypothetical protein BJ742DRAFT_775004 [Cladochytrium replicatum]|nr:hypothetical protein BJ742DRAFT_775004 [Cladochytrium replicatum]
MSSNLDSKSNHSSSSNVINFESPAIPKRTSSILLNTSQETSGTYSQSSITSTATPQGIILLKGSVHSSVGTAVAPSLYGSEITSNDPTRPSLGTSYVQLQQPVFYAIPAGAFVQPKLDDVKGMERKVSWVVRYKWALLVGIVVILAAIIIPTAVVLSNNARGSNSNGSGGPSATSALGSIPTVYPTSIPNGSILINPIVTPSNNPAIRFDLSAIQNAIAVFRDQTFEYRVAFARSLSTSERTLPNPPIRYNYCTGVDVAVCQNDAAGGSFAFGAGQIATFSAASVAVNGTQGLQMSFGAAVGDSARCTRKASIIILCSNDPSGSAAPAFVRLDATTDTAANICTYNIYFLHASGCAKPLG